MTPILRIVLRTLAVVATLAALPPGAAGQANPHGPLPADLDCTACHTPTGWRPMRPDPTFVHGAGGFRLEGAHAEATCAGCHADLRFDGPEISADDCAGCHVDVHEGRLVDDCAACHDATSFQDVDGTLVHARTALPLDGAHRDVPCAGCHSEDGGGLFTGLEAECISCHRGDWNGTATVDHEAAGYPTDCTVCHTAQGWSDAPLFDHGTVSGGYLLEGAHTVVGCAGCHQLPAMDLLFQPAGAGDCVACHQADFDREHPGSSFTSDCATCHSVTAWDVPGFDHDLTGFGLVGAHAPLECGDCHTDGHRGLRFDPPDGEADCVACHRADYDEEHGGSGFPLACASCHQPTDWDDADFDHADTGFPLQGAHADQDCTGCHGPTGGLVVPSPSAPDDCVACHQADFEGEHGGSGFPTACLDCHDQLRWEGAEIDHPALADGFDLLGRHSAAECTSCHTVPDWGLRFAAPAGQADCVVCHETDYQREHAGSPISRDCAACHDESGWEGAEFDHAGTGFPLAGAHEAAECSTCHGEGGTLVVPQPSGAEDCVACHQLDYDGEHGGSGLPTTCLDCHDQTTWEGAEFDHSTQGFDLVGAHEVAECSSCHAIPGYTLVTGTPAFQDDCVACHQTEFDAEHAGTGYPSTCLVCHDQTAWGNASFDHDAQYFPIYSGRHQSEWNGQCATCHTVPDDYAVFSCIDCHEHRQSEADKEHSEVSGYAWESSACLSCHPNGRK